MDYEKKIREYMVSSKVDQLYKSMLNNLFPELKESEDEKIRKWIIENIQETLDVNGFFENQKTMAKKALSWLEKQGEQKHLELKAGHWYICHRAYCCRADNLTVKEGERFMCEKDGIVKGFVIKDAEKYFKECSAPAPMEGEQKPAWSEEDEEILNLIIARLHSHPNVDLEEYSKEYDWLNYNLKSLRPQTTWKPSDEQIRVVARLRHCLLEDVRGDDIVILDNLLEQLKAL